MKSKHFTVLFFLSFLSSASIYAGEYNGFINIRECPDCEEIYCSDYSQHDCEVKEEVAENESNESQDSEE